MKRLLVVIPHRNGRDLLLRALAAVEVAVDSTCDDVLVVDNNGVATRDVGGGLIPTFDRDPHIGVVGPGL